MYEEWQGNQIWLWMAGGATVIVGFLILLLLKKVIAHVIGRFAARTKTKADDLLVSLVDAKTKRIFLFVFAVFFGTLWVGLNKNLEQLVYKATLVTLLLQVAFWGSGILNHWLSRIFKKEGEDADPNLISAQSAISFLSSAALWAVIVLAILHNLGMDITTFVAGLGVGGIAIALALQNILGDLFASLSIIIDKPFVVGDFIIVGDLKGTVEKIGVKTTRVRSLSGEQLVFGNTDLLKSRIRNYKRMQERRIAFDIGVTYETPGDKLAKIPEIIKNAVETLENTRFDRAHFMRFGDSALVYEIIYYVTQPDYIVYADTQQKINLELYRIFVEEGIEFAYPTQTLFVNNVKPAA
ncbi:MAG: mechanosensitive ion channel family protein [Planctomycetota bacterium]|jgi:small-conductance mechanosensitive channel